MCLREKFAGGRTNLEIVEMERIAREVQNGERTGIAFLKICHSESI
jgi:hypothetical protein